MRKNFERLIAGREGLAKAPRFWLQVAAGTLAALNLVALYFYLVPPGGEPLVNVSKMDFHPFHPPPD